MDDVPERIEHTVLGPETGWDDVAAVLDEALADGMRACIPPWAVAAADDYANVRLTTVLDFPHGQGSPEAVAEAGRRAWTDGADELDLVVNVGRLKAGDDEAVRGKIAEVVAAVPVPVKVIVEAPLLTDDELDRVGRLAADADAAYLKTATGFADGGATVEDVERLSRFLPVKASGGVGSWSDAKAMFDAGAERIGASSGDVIVSEWREATGRADTAMDDDAPPTDADAVSPGDEERANHVEPANGEEPPDHVEPGDDPANGEDEAR